MTNFKVGYLIGSLAKALHQPQARQGAGATRPRGTRHDGDPVQGSAALQLRLRRRFPAVARAFKEAIAAVDAVLFVTPEYNRSIPGGLKNAIDWASRPYGTNSFTRKPSAVIGTSPGAIGTAIAQQSLRSVLSFCNSPQMNAHRSLYPVHPGPHHRRRRGDEQTRRGNSCATTWPSSTASSRGSTPPFRARTPSSAPRWKRSRGLVVQVERKTERMRQRLSSIPPAAPPYAAAAAQVLQPSSAVKLPSASKKASNSP